jgi:hypothetical protein
MTAAMGTSCEAELNVNKSEIGLPYPAIHAAVTEKRAGQKFNAVSGAAKNASPSIQDAGIRSIAVQH